MEEKKDYRDELFYQPKNGYDRLSSEEADKVESYCEGYKAYLRVSWSTCPAWSSKQATRCGSPTAARR